MIHKTSGNLENICIVKLTKPEQFVLMSLLRVCQEWAVKKDGTWRILKIPDSGHGGQGHPWPQV